MVVETNALVLVVFVDVLASLDLVVAHVMRPTAGFLFDLEPRVDIVFEQPLAGFFEMPHFVEVVDAIPQLDGGLELGGAPRANQRALVVRVVAPGGSLQERFDHFCFHAGGTKGKGKFASMAEK